MVTLERIDLKADDGLISIHESQMLSFQKSGCKVGFLINGNVKILKDGMKLSVNSFQNFSAFSERSLR